MKRLISIILVVMLTFTLCAAALAAPVAGSLTVTRQNVRGNSSWTAESYPEIWITPLFDQYIIAGMEDYPPHFLRFAPPEGTCGLEFNNDYSAVINHDTLMITSYYCLDRASFELFLEKAEGDMLIADGKDGLAMYVDLERNRAYAMIDLKEQFGGTAKLEIDLYDASRALSKDALTEAIKAEADRVKSAMALEKLDGYWSDDVFASVELYDTYDPVTAVVDTQGLIITKLEDNSVTWETKTSERDTATTRVSIDTYMNSEATDATLADGTAYKVFNYDYTGYAFFPVLEGKHGQIYMAIEIETSPEEFPAALEAVYPRVAVKTE